MMPCGGDAWEPYAPHADDPLLRACMYCDKADHRGGKCDWYRWFFRHPLFFLKPGDKHGMEDTEQELEGKTGEWV